MVASVCRTPAEMESEARIVWARLLMDWIQESRRRLPTEAMRRQVAFVLLDLGDRWVRRQAAELFGEENIIRFVSPRQAAIDGGSRRVPPIPYLDVVPSEVGRHWLADRAPNLDIWRQGQDASNAVVIGAFGGFDLLPLPPV